MRDDVKKDKYGFSDPNAVMGFTRGMDGVDPRDAKQEEYQNKDGPMDMPPDLIKFLNDVGPLERKVDKEFTSPRLRESLHQHELERREHEQDSRRKVSEMPLMGVEMDHVTRRTTNFSTAAAKEDEGFGLTGVQMYEMLALNKSNEELWKDSCNGDESEKDAQLELIESCRKYLELPIVMKDKDSEYLGLSESTVETSDMFRLALMPATGVKLVMSQLLDRENERKVQEATEKKVD